jgi:hypothetical protein
MSAPLTAPVAIATDERDQFVVTHGKSGVIGVFTMTEAVVFKRGDRVLVQSGRGLEIGVVLGPATVHQARLFGATSSGILLRAVVPQDDTRLVELKAREEVIYDAARGIDGAELEVLDVDLLFDGVNAIVQFVGNEDAVEVVASKLEAQLGLTIRMENLTLPTSHDEHRCDKPDCGRESGGCTSCSTGGGCSSCGTGKVDMREYFGHLRTKMEQRIPLA